ncbi:MAG: L-glyceraldehyde 3-phosphate reductase [Cytophagaceae bacterium]|jgi:L-glyceraldehyde 3-phosphate reductase|nr:L-glyceraldehyde 3-phosphate reductase [Cytophagaceae bacterium]
MIYLANSNRYEKMIYRRCGNSGIQLPALSLGLWHNFGSVDKPENMKEMLKLAFDNGITHFDLANNYGPEPGSAEENFGNILTGDFKSYRDEVLISTKAGYYMWAGPYGDWGSKKHLTASLNQSLRRMKVDYVDIFYSHRRDPNTPLEETMGTLDSLVRQGKALYAGISNYSPDDTQKAANILRNLGTPCLIHQPRYNIFDRAPENGLLNVLETEKIGCIAFSPLAQGLLTNRYLNTIPDDSRIAKPHGFLQKESLTAERLQAIRQLNDIAQKRGQTLAQMSIAWLLRDKRITSVLIGASSPRQLEDNLQSLKNIDFTEDELSAIDRISIPVLMYRG